MQSSTPKILNFMHFKSLHFINLTLNNFYLDLIFMVYHEWIKVVELV